MLKGYLPRAQFPVTYVPENCVSTICTYAEPDLITWPQHTDGLSVGSAIHLTWAQSIKAPTPEIHAAWIEGPETL